MATRRLPLVRRGAHPSLARTRLPGQAQGLADPQVGGIFGVVVAGKDQEQPCIAEVTGRQCAVGIARADRVLVRLATEHLLGVGGQLARHGPGHHVVGVSFQVPGEIPTPTRVATTLEIIEDRVQRATVGRRGNGRFLDRRGFGLLAFTPSHPLQARIKLAELGTARQHGRAHQ